ncbi:MAG: hypothetical protein BGO01_05775 [Armatimonadetes bacterium 55-13]|nr:hypothetical protein [Armatimonadota bacterium]OJU61577.1 MAG: hypothetical protein BGO01_05775 [Armatimonadetes bacterium 55-13]
MEPIRYKPGEAIRWLETAADSYRKTAKSKGKEAVDLKRDRSDFKKVGQNVADAASALYDYGKGAWADMLHRQAEASEFVLQEHHFDVVNGTAIKTVAYDRVEQVTMKGDTFTFKLDKGSITIKPHAYIVSGRVKVPVGWSRNGMEVPYELLIEELCARSRVNLEHL